MGSPDGPTIAVTGMTAGDSPAPGVAVVRSLRAHPAFKGRVIGLAYDAMEAGNFIEGVADDVFLIPYPSQGEEDFLQRLLYIKEGRGLDVLLPTLDSELPIVIRKADWLASKGIATFLPTEEQFQLRAKDRLSEMAKTHGLPAPRSVAVNDASEVVRLGREFEFPLLVKGLFYEALAAYSIQEAISHFRTMAHKWGLPVILQEYVRGDEYDVAAVGDGKGGVVGAVPMRKLQMSDKGKAWAGVTVADDALLELTRRTMAALKWRGPMELEVMKSGGDYFILEINPRFPAWIYLAQGAGQNLPYACLQLALGERVAPLAAHRPGTVFIRAAMDFVMPLAALEAITTKGESAGRRA